MAVTIRSGRLADVEAVLELWQRAGAEPSHTDDVAGLATLMARDPSALILAEDDRAIIGSVVAGWDGWRGSIYRLVVDPSHRRLGIGSQLVREAEARLRSHGAIRMQAIVVETEERATAFWRATGWDRQAARLRFVKG